jgi:hypothetical protein
VLFDYQTYRWRRDKFWCYLMWQPKRRPFSIPVPLKLAQWNWRGATGKTNDAAWPWRLNGWTNARMETGFDYPIHPVWDTYITGETIKSATVTNNWWHPTP